MIPRDYITEWRARAPWVGDFQVEQDLVINRTLVEIFSHPHLRESLVFRGGTALYKLHIDPPARYSEDIDLVQIRAEPIGPTLNALARCSQFLARQAAMEAKRGAGHVELSLRVRGRSAPAATAEGRDQFQGALHPVRVQRKAARDLIALVRWRSEDHHLCL